MASGGFGSTMGGPSQAQVEQKLRAEAVVRNGAGWFMWIAGLSILKCAYIHVAECEIHPVLQIAEGERRRQQVVGLDAVVGMQPVVRFHFARQGQKWAFLVGMGLYLIDGLILLPFKDILGVAFHAYALFRIYSGMQGVSALETLRSARAPAGAPIEPR